MINDGQLMLIIWTQLIMINGAVGYTMVDSQPLIQGSQPADPPTSHAAN